jgi:succinyl-CoA synthetase beta subunit
VELFEYQVKSLLSRAGVVCSEYVVVDSSSDLPAVLSRLGGGEKIIRPQVRNGRPEELIEEKGLEERIRALLGFEAAAPTSGPEENTSSKVLVMVPTTPEKIYRVSVSINQEGEVELVASQQGKKVYFEHLFEGSFRPFQINRLVASTGLKGRQAALFKKMIEGALQAFFRYDAFSLELQSIALTEGGTFEVIDARMACDDRALYRQPELRLMADRFGEGAYVFPCLLIDGGGTIACIGNGIGLALVTADLLKLQKGFPGRVIDVGSECATENIIAGMKMVGSAKAAIIHLFTGLVDGEMVAKRIQKEHPKIPTMVFLDGTNASGGRRVLKEGRRFMTAESLLEALQTVVQKGGK